jgi:hypothetical protein
VLEDAQEIFTEQSLLQAYEWDKLIAVWQENLDAFQSRSIAEQDTAHALSFEIMQHLMDEQNTANKFIRLLNDFLKQGKAAYPAMHERTLSAALWFSQHLDDHVIKKIKQHIDDYKVKAKTKKYIKEVKEALLFIERKKIQIQQTVAITEGLATSLNREQLMERVSKLHTPVEVKSDAASSPSAKVPVGETKRITLKMFQEGKTIDEIVATRSLAKSTIEGHLVEFIPTGEVDIFALIPKEKLAIITKAIKENPEATSGAIRIQIGEQYSFAEIKAAIAFYKKENSL